MRKIFLISFFILSHLGADITIVYDTKIIADPKANSDEKWKN